MRNELGIGRKFNWTPERVKYVADNYLKISGKNIARHFNCDPGTIKRYLKKNNLVVTKEIRYRLQAEKRTGFTTFTPAEDRFIRKNYLAMPIKLLGEQIGRSYTGVMARLDAMGLVIPSEIIERNRKSAQIKPGNVPKNKGKKQADYMSQDKIDKTAATRFKKGNVPPNTKNADGVITIRHEHANRNGGRPVKYIRLSLGVWRPLHTYNWEQQNGPLLKGHCLWCLDGDTLNAEPSNYELISRKENYLRNSGSVQLTDKYVASQIAWRNPELKQEMLQQPDILEIKRAQINLNRAIIKQLNEKI